MLILSLLLLVLPLNSQFTTVAIVALNDIHGSALPTQMQRQDTLQNYTAGGLMYMGGLIEIIKNQYPGNTLVLDAGDQFQGGIESSPLISSGKIMNEFYNTVGTSGQAIGNHEFDFGPQVLLPFYEEKESDVLAANIRSEKGQSQFLPRQKASQIYEAKSGVRIGVIGLSTIATPETTNGFSGKLFPPYKFLDYKDIVIEESCKLRGEGADAVIVVGHLGNTCGKTGNAYGKWTVNTKQEDCNNGGESTELINSLPEGTIDAIIQGHRHSFVHHFHNEVPFVGTISGGYYFNILYLRFYKQFLYEKVIEGPVPVCERIFSNLGTCEYLPRQQLIVAGELVPYRFHNQEVKAHPTIKAIYEQEWIPKMAPFLEVLARSEVYLDVKSEEECELVNLITSLLHQVVPTSDFVLINPGGLRSAWYPGLIQYQHLYNMFPFVNYLISFDITGKELLGMLSIVQSGGFGFYPMFGINIVAQIDSSKAHRFINATLANGSMIEPDRVYRGLSIDFLLNGGDDFKKVIGVTYTPRNTQSHGLVREMLRKPLQNLRVVKAETWIDPNNKRLIVLK